MERTRIETVYSEYEKSESYKKIHSPLGISSYYQHALKKHLLFLFREMGLTSLSGLKILDIGIGKGSNIPDFYKFGIDAKHLYGLDILVERLKYLRRLYTDLYLINSDAVQAPIKSKSFDLVFQFVVFSSILDNSVCKAVSSEMLRVLKDDGIIVWYDSYGGKKMSEHTRSYSEKDIKNFFPECSMEFKRIIPHSQLSFRLAKYEHGWLALDIIENIFPFLNCMQLCVIRKKL